MSGQLDGYTGKSKFLSLPHIICRNRFWMNCRSNCEDKAMRLIPFLGICCCSVAKMCLTLWNSMNCVQMLHFPVLHCLPELSLGEQSTVSIELVMPSNHLILCLPLILNLSQHQDLFQWVSSLYQVVKVLEFQLMLNTQDWFPLRWSGWISLLSKGSQESFPVPQFRSINSSWLTFLYSSILISIYDYWKNHSFD